MRDPPKPSLRAVSRSLGRERDSLRARGLPGRGRGRLDEVTRASLALLLGSIAGLLAALQPINDTDMWWHLATGRETLATGFVRADIFSWTIPGAPVTTDQWLGQIAMYLSYLVAGWRGIAILRVLLVTALVALTAWSAAGRTARPLAIVLATLPAMFLTRAIAVDRPELLGFVCFPALLVLVRSARP